MKSSQIKSNLIVYTHDDKDKDKDKNHRWKKIENYRIIIRVNIIITITLKTIRLARMIMRMARMIIRMARMIMRMARMIMRMARMIMRASEDNKTKLAL